MNARNFLYIRRYNKPSAKRLADDKLETKKKLIEHNLSSPTLFASFYDRDQIREFDWTTLPTNGFVIKPARGYGGSGILPIKKWEGGIAKTVSGEEYTKEQLESQLLDILEGAYSLQYLPDKAFIEERIIPDPFFKKLGSVGIPDIRIICFNKIPIMAMMRLPTAESHGKANLHLGALALGIDMRTGITTSAVYKGNIITTIPATKLKTRGIKLPDWDDLMLLASRTQAIIRLGYAGVDIVLDAKKGPMVLEVNARPGLQIQVANQDSLRTRLERVEHMTVTTSERGVEVAKSLFASSFSEKVVTGPKVLSVIEPVILKGKTMEKVIHAKVDTGAFRSSIDADLAAELGFTENVAKKVYVQSASGNEYRPTGLITYEIAGKKVTTTASIVDRSHLQYPMIIGRRDLRGFLVNPEILVKDEEIDDYVTDGKNK